MCRAAILKLYSLSPNFSEDSWKPTLPRPSLWISESDGYLEYGFSCVPRSRSSDLLAQGPHLRNHRGKSDHCTDQHLLLDQIYHLCTISAVQSQSCPRSHPTLAGHLYLVIGWCCAKGDGSAGCSFSALPEAVPQLQFSLCRVLSASLVLWC